MKIIKVVIWFILFIMIFNLSLYMISNPSSIENIVGFCLLCFDIVVSIKTKCLLNLKLNKNEK